MADELLSWFTQSGGKLHPAVTIAPQADGRGFRLVLKETPKSTRQTAVQLIVSCPHTLALSVLAIPLVAPWWPARWMDSLEVTVLTRFVLVESWSQGAGALFSKYIAMLPSPAASPPYATPLYWTEEERATIRGTNLYESTIAREECWRREFEAARASLLQQTLPASRRQSVSLYSLGLYLWAATVLSSRCFGQYLIAPQDQDIPEPLADNAELTKTQLWQRWVSRDQTLRFPVLLPVLDAANHDPQADVGWNNSGNATQLLVSIDNMSVGQEIFNNYGQKPNEELILGYGFDLPQNRADSFLIPLALGHRKDKFDLIRALVQQALPIEATQVLLPQILDPAATVQAHAVYALRDKEDPLSSAAATPLALMALNTRELHDRRCRPVSIPSHGASYSPSHNSLETLLALAYILQRDVAKIHATEEGVPAQTVIDTNANMQMGMRHRQSQLRIIEHGTSSLQDTLKAWFSTKRIIGINDLLTDVLPRPLLKRFRQMIHQALGTRNVGKLISKDLSEAVFVYWLMNLAIEFEDLELAYVPDMDFDDQQTMSLPQLGTWLQKIMTAYGTHDIPAEDAQEESNICWKLRDADEARSAADEYERMLTWHKVWPNVTALRKRIDWALRVVREETVWVPAWLHNDSEDDDDVDGDSGDEKSQGSKEQKDMLVWVLLESEQSGAA